MSEPAPTSEHSTAPPASPVQAADAAYRFGEQVGRFAALTLRQLGAAAAAGLARARAATVPDAPVLSARRDPDSARTARAEEMVSRAATDVGALAAGAGERLREAAALAREEAEDLWADAQELRRRGQRDARDTP